MVENVKMKSETFQRKLFKTITEIALMPHIMLLQVLKSPYHGFLKMNIHVVWNIALSQ